MKSVPELGTTKFREVQPAPDIGETRDIKMPQRRKNDDKVKVEDESFFVCRRCGLELRWWRKCGVVLVAHVNPLTGWIDPDGFIYCTAAPLEEDRPFHSPREVTDVAGDLRRMLEELSS